MKTWKIPVVWQEAGVIEVKAKSLKEAIVLAEDHDGLIPIPDNGKYINESWEVDCYDMDYVRQHYNGGQKDDIALKTKEEIYDELSRVLTEWETQEAVDDDLYNMLVKIQNNWETVITACEC